MEEIELKFKIEDPEAIKQKLAEVGAKNEGKVQQRDLWIDTPDKRWKKQGKGLRIRQQKRVPGGTPQSAQLFLALKDEQSYGKVRKALEIEVDVGGSFEEFKNFWERLGFVADCFLEKEREVWKLGALEIVLDDVKDLGIFLELEGPEEEIEAAIIKLGLEKEPRIVEHYGQLIEKR